MDVLLWGGTHRFEAYEMEGKFFVNPGSATGAFSTGWWREGDKPTPSFCLMDVSIPHMSYFIVWAHGFLRGVGGRWRGWKKNIPKLIKYFDFIGPRRCSGFVCISTQDGSERRGERRRRKGFISEK